MKVPARLLTLLIAISLIMGVGANGAFDANVAMDEATMAAVEMPISNDCGDCGTDRVMPCSTNVQCSLPMAIIPTQPAVPVVELAFLYGKADVEFVGRSSRPDPHPPKR